MHRYLIPRFLKIAKLHHLLTELQDGFRLTFSFSHFNFSGLPCRIFLLSSKVSLPFLSCYHRTKTYRSAGSTVEAQNRFENLAGLHINFDVQKFLCGLWILLKIVLRIIQDSIRLCFILFGFQSKYKAFNTSYLFQNHRQSIWNFILVIYLVFSVSFKFLS